MAVWSVQKEAHGFKAKVSDWGMLRELDTRGFASQQKYPSLNHLAPEVLLKGTMSKVPLHLSPMGPPTCVQPNFLLDFLLNNHFRGIAANKTRTGVLAATAV